MDRLGRSLRHLIDTVTDLQEKGVGFKSLTESIDTTTSGGKLVFHIFGALAEFEREIIRERTRAGLQSARARGRNGGRRMKLLGDVAQFLEAGFEFEQKPEPDEEEERRVWGHLGIPLEAVRLAEPHPELWCRELGDVLADNEDQALGYLRHR